MENSAAITHSAGPGSSGHKNKKNKNRKPTQLKPNLPVTSVHRTSKALSGASGIEGEPAAGNIAVAAATGTSTPASAQETGTYRAHGPDDDSGLYDAAYPHLGAHAEDIDFYLPPGSMNDPFQQQQDPPQQEPTVAVSEGTPASMRLSGIYTDVASCSVTPNCNPSHATSSIPATENDADGKSFQHAAAGMAFDNIGAITPEKSRSDDATENINPKSNMVNNKSGSGSGKKKQKKKQKKRSNDTWRDVEARETEDTDLVTPLKSTSTVAAEQSVVMKQSSTPWTPAATISPCTGETELIEASLRVVRRRSAEPDSDDESPITKSSDNSSSAACRRSGAGAGAGAGGTSTDTCPGTGSSTSGSTAYAYAAAGAELDQSDSWMQLSDSGSEKALSALNLTAGSTDNAETTSITAAAAVTWDLRELSYYQIFAALFYRICSQLQRVVFNLRSWLNPFRIFGIAAGTKQRVDVDVDVGAPAPSTESTAEEPQEATLSSTAKLTCSTATACISNLSYAVLLLCNLAVGILVIAPASYALSLLECTISVVLDSVSLLGSLLLTVVRGTVSAAMWVVYGYCDVLLWMLGNMLQLPVYAFHCLYCLCCDIISQSGSVVYRAAAFFDYETKLDSRRAPPNEVDEKLPTNPTLTRTLLG